MTGRKILKYVIFIVAALSIIFGGINQTQPSAAMPGSPTDQTKVPHYFGPYPNWANSPFTLPDVAVQITGDGSGATAVASIGGNGAVTGITITDPGLNYTSAGVSITGAGNGATASATVTLTGIISGITVDTAGSGYVAPVVTFSGGGAAVTPASITPSATSDTYNVTVGSASGGSFALVVNSISTAAIAWNALPGDVQTALGNAGFPAAVTGSGALLDPYVIVFATPPASFAMNSSLLTQSGTVPVLDAAVTAAATHTYNVTAGSATGGSFTLNVDGTISSAIAWNALATDVTNAFPVSFVTSVTDTNGTGPWVIVFASAPVSVTIDPANLTQGVADAAVTLVTADTFNVTVGSATGGSFLLTVDATQVGPLAWNILAADLQTALANAGFTATVSGSGSLVDPWVIVFTPAPATVVLGPAGLTKGVLDAAASASATSDTYNVTVGSATGGSFLLAVNGTSTGAIAFNALPGDVQTALANAGFTATVTGSGTLVDPYVVLFATTPSTFTIDATGLTQTGTVPVSDAGFTAGLTHTYSANVGTATGGTFLLTVDGFTTAPIAWNALAAAVQTALSNVGVAAAVTGSGTTVDPWVIIFANAPTSVTINGAALTQPLVGATATAYGGVNAIALDAGGSGYTMPTVDFDLPDGPGGVQAQAHAVIDVNGTVTSIVIDNPGSGYSRAPNMVIRDGTLFDPILNGGSGALAHATLSIQSITVETFGSNYVSAPLVFINDSQGAGTGASATATVSAGGVTSITVLNAGSGYNTTGGIKKFQDGLPVLCDPRAGWANCTDNNLGQHIPIAVPDTTTFPGADYYVIAVVQHRERMSSSLPAAGTLLREYVQLETPANAAFSKSVALQTDLLNNSSVPTLMPDKSQAIAVDDPHFLGPIIVANKNRPVRIVFYNLLPTGSEGNLFLPVDSTLMGSGMGPMTNMTDPVDQGTVMDAVRNPMCSEYPKSDMCFMENRATLHLHGGTSPWISDGTAHQWITPANEATSWPHGVDVAQVPDMNNVAGVPDCSVPNAGCLTFYYTNQQSARLLFYHDHSWGITRLNVYAGEAAGYVITDDTEKALLAPGGALEGFGVGTPLIIQDRTFVPDTAQLAAADPTWDSSRWGGYGNFWYHHVYMPAQNPGDPGGMSGYGRWMYGPWFWPPATPQHGPIANPYYDPNCNLDNPATWQYQTDPFCEPQLIPGTPNISVGMEQFNDTPLVNGTAYPYLNVDPKAYRFRILNAANDRFWNLQWYIADPRTGTLSEVALNPAELAAAQTDPVVFPTPDQTWSPAGPDWVVIGSEGGFLPAPVVVDGQQPTTWITDPTRFDVGNVDLHSLVLGPAERADVIVDFSRFAGQTLIMYNDAPAAYPARVPSYDYYTGAPDQSPVGAPSILPGYGPNTRTIMKIVVGNTTPATPFDIPGTSNDGLGKLQNAFKHHADGSGVFEKGQHPIIVGQAAYNSAYGTNFAASSWCNAPGSTSTRCDGLLRISEQGGTNFAFNTLKNPASRTEVYIQPKALHDEMNAVSFDEFGRMTANIGVEAVPATPMAQNVTLYPFVNPATELIDATNLPKLDAAGIGMTPISVGNDGTQIWKITHNGVDTHPIHFHLYDVQILNRVTWDNIIIPTEGTELGWKDTIRVSPLQDTIVALRPVIPYVPFELPNSIRLLNPMMPAGSTLMFNNIDPQGNPTNAIVNQMVNFGWQYVYHCHILSHEEMDMMRPVSVALPPIVPTGLTWSVTGSGNNTVLTLSWMDNSLNETSFLVQRFDGTAWSDLGTVPSPLDQPNTHGPRSFADNTFHWNGTSYAYRVVAQNTVGYGAEFPSMTVKSTSASVAVIQAPTSLSASLLVGPQVSLSWMDNSGNETGFAIWRSTDGVSFTQIATAPAHNNTGVTGYTDLSVTLGTTYFYKVAAVNALGSSTFSNLVAITVSAPPAPSNLLVSVVRQGNNERATLTWADNSNNEASFQIQRATDANFTLNVTTTTVAANTTTFTTGNIARVAWYFRISAVNALGNSAWVDATPFPAPIAP